MTDRVNACSLRSPTTKSSASVSAYSGNFRSTPRTQKPSRFSRLTRCDPMNPPAPHMRAVFMHYSRKDHLWGWLPSDVASTRPREDPGFDLMRDILWAESGGVFARPGRLCAPGAEATRARSTFGTSDKARGVKT